MINAILIDDEKAARESLRIILEQYCKEWIAVIGEAGDIDSAYELINRKSPDVVFLDIEMGTFTGFDLIGRFPDPSFKVIFVTAYDHYALRAIKISAFDYLLKPLNINEVVESARKATDLMEVKSKGSWENLANAVKKKGDSSNQIAIPIAGGYRIIPARDIVYLKADREYTYIYCTNGEVFCSSTNLGYYDDLLEDYPFFRIHHSYIVNRLFILEYQKNDAGEVKLSGDIILPVSRRRKTDFLEWLKS